MPQIKSAIKRMKTSAQRHERNKSVKTELKTLNKNLRETAKGKDNDAAKAMLNETYAKYDKAAKKGIVHPKNAARNKAKLAKLVNNTSSKGDK